MSSPIFAQLEASLADYLADVSHRARCGDIPTAAGVARTELPKLVDALLAVLDEHDPDETGRCPRCRPGRFARTPMPCRAYLSAHLCLITAEDAPKPTEVAVPKPAEVTAPMRRTVALAGRPGHVNASG